MTPTELLIRRFLDQATRLQPDLASQLLRDFERLREILGDAALERAMREAGLDRVIFEELSDEALDEVFAGFRVELQKTLEEATRYAARAVPGLRPTVAFNVLSPHVIEAARVLDTRVMQTLRDSIRGAFRETLRIGLEEGVGPRVIARRVRETVGLAPNQVRAIDNFRRMLTEGDRTALRRQLRDRRFDRTLQRTLGVRGTGLSEEQIERMVKAYDRRFRAFNAEVNARTAALDALKLGQRLSWDEAITKGIVDRRRLYREWTNVGDSRVRPTHRDPPEGINGEIRQFDETYSNGQTVPGDTEFNCRCLDRYFVKRKAA